jgi:hypothetical protein
MGDSQSQLTCLSQVVVEKWQAIFKQFLCMMIIRSLIKWSGPYHGASENGKENLVYLIAYAETSQTYTPLVV